MLKETRMDNLYTRWVSLTHQAVEQGKGAVLEAVIQLLLVMSEALHRQHTPENADWLLDDFQQVLC